MGKIVVGISTPLFGWFRLPGGAGEGGGEGAARVDLRQMAAVGDGGVEVGEDVHAVDHCVGGGADGGLVGALALKGGFDVGGAIGHRADAGDTDAATLDGAVRGEGEQSGDSD